MFKQTQIELGASLYVPLTHSVDTIVAIANGNKIHELRSVIFDTEDSVREDQLFSALTNLQLALPQFEVDAKIKRFVRVRNPEILSIVLSFEAVTRLDGFVLPKVTSANLHVYSARLSDNDSFFLMPTLETAEAFDIISMTRLRESILEDPKIRERILCLRIGANDLLSCLSSRRNPRSTVYDTAIGHTIGMLSGVFIPYGIGLSAPVFEVMNNPALLQKEIEQDLDFGLLSKTAIHPSQIALIEEAYAVSSEDLSEARQILDVNAPAVFRASGDDGKGQRMCEPTTHANWARLIVARAETYGVRKAPANSVSQLTLVK